MPRRIKARPVSWQHCTKCHETGREMYRRKGTEEVLCLDCYQKAHAVAFHYEGQESRNRVGQIIYECEAV